MEKRSEAVLRVLRTLLVFQAVLAVGVARIVAVPKFTLLRVEGTEAIIPCNVSDYSPLVEQNFEWKFSQGGGKIPILSTLDDTFVDQQYKSRTESGEITLNRISDSAVELHIKNLKLSDEGSYICETPSTDAKVEGNYDDKVYLKVIPDGLKLALPPSFQLQSENVTEGEAFQLQCSASTTSRECIQIAITWEVKTEASGDNSQQVFSLTQDNRLQPGSKYKERYQNGDIRLESQDNDIYLLTISHALPVDKGSYSCVATEWTRETNGSWQKVQKKSIEIAKVDIQPISELLSVSTVGGNTSLNRGEDMDLTCSITTGNHGAVGTEVTWYFSTVLTTNPESYKLLASMDRDSVMNRSDHGIISRMDTSTYQYLVRKAEETDSGYYYCSVILWLPESKNTWYKAAEKISSAVQVTVTILEPTYKVQLTTSTVPKFTEDPAELRCTISDLQNAEDARLIISWYFKQTLADGQVSTPDLIAEMDQDSSLLIGEKYRDRAEKGMIIFSKPESRSFTLRIQWSEDSDRGNYSCAVSAWIGQHNGSWEKSKVETSNEVNIFWAQEEPKVYVKAVQQGSLSSGGNTFQMVCEVSSQNIKMPRYSVLVTKEQPSSGTKKKLISLSHEAVVNLEDKDYVENVFLEKINEDQFRFRITQTQISDTGMYYCTVTAWTPSGGGGWKETVSTDSNGLKVEFQTSGPALNVTLHLDNPTVKQYEMVELMCIITVEGAAEEAAFSLDDTAYDVNWFAVRSYEASGSVFLASLNRTGVVTQARRNGSSDISVERISLLRYRLRVHGCRDDDSGNHFCSVTPWVRKSSDGTWVKSSEMRSNQIFITVHTDLLSTFKLPVVCGIGISFVVGLLACLIGYCSARWCCKKDVQEARRDHRRLMSMEMD